MTVEHNHLTNYQLPPSILQYLPIAGSKVVDATQHGQSHYGRTTRLTIQLPSGSFANYFLKTLEGELGMVTCRGEYESLKSIYSVCAHTPAPVGWGRYTEDNIDYSFLLVEFMAIQKQPADAKNLAACLAELHLKSQSPTGKFGFHVPTCHTRNVQAVDFWTDSWCELFSSHLSRIISHAKAGFAWPEFDNLGKLILSKVVPALLLPLQTDGRSIKPCLVHGDCWDGNTATGEDGRPLFFDVASFYAHNEYDLGNWRASRHALSDSAYTDAYKALVPVSEPESSKT
ncbi:hypothetical protein N7489_007883 [Penicillium chrysogenum]|uniref:protein-ribulosamine 3-kinase n=1 Tax=Penicillium chrysogenum TaxID=5076 RepID=A0ABQ8WC22_PENCH|nr:uncharacterized protein N7489_007883 [Penicillium chrysogenum]KAJ5237792.1 hypothetical protein N7489_007883 [Penicillium chrysogenum]KAJ5261946.1 hypothetical protein N7505_008813 [Penicillium chrysogenum]KAJ6159876.1 hypothetical protein N7497_004413 [Penicillium chrysogenum]